MAFNLSREITTADEKEILKFPVGLHSIKSVVLDAKAFSISNPGLERYEVPAGTILKISSTDATKYAPYDGTGTIRGILARKTDLAAAVTGGERPVAMFFFGCVFATTAIVSFTQYASALVADLGNYNKFE